MSMLKFRRKKPQSVMRSSKGILQSLEALIAILMIMSIFLMFYGPIEAIPEFRSINWKMRGFTALEALDQNNELRTLVLANDTAGIERRLQALLPNDLDYDVFVCKTACGNPDITSEQLVSVSYIIAGNATMFEPRYLMLYMW